jgi:hypoxanthine phosphoribosyltransferase
MSYLSEYRKSDFKKMTWEDYGTILERLYSKVKKYIDKNDIKIDSVVPILRGGAFPGAFLSFRLGLLRMTPVQYKYFLDGKNITLRRIMIFPKKSLRKKRPIFLLVENNHCFGITASAAAKDLKRMYPSCKIIYATDHVDYSYQSVEGVDAIFFGRLTNETRKLSKKQCKEKGIENVSYLFPWEGLNEEWTTVRCKQFPYTDLKDVLSTSIIKKKIKN